MGKRVLALFLALTMGLALLPAAALAAGSGFEMDGTVLIKYTGPGGDVVIPEGTTWIGCNAFQNCTGLTSVSIPDSVTSVGDFAFDGCTGLTGVTIPGGVTTIETYTFRNCVGLTNVTIPDSVTSIRGAAFSGCTGLTYVIIPGSVTEIGELAFKDCTGLDNITISASVISLGFQAFYNCANLASVTIPASVTRIGDFSFGNCAGLNTIQVSSGNPAYTSIDGVLFTKDAKNLITCPGGKQGAYTIPSSVTSIEDYAFSHCSSLTSVTVPSSVTSIGESAFSDCANLTSVSISSSVTEIGAYAFYGCTGLTDIYYGGTQEQWNAIKSGAYGSFRNDLTNAAIHCNSPIPEPPTSGACGDNLTWTLENGVLAISGTGAMVDYNYAEAPWYELRFNISAVVIGQGVTTIGSFAFSECPAVTSVAIPNSVTSIGQGAFRECTRLTSVTIPDSVSKIASAVFYGCTGLTSAAVPDSVTEIGDYLFCDCAALTSVAIPSGLTEIPETMFYGCTSLTSVNIPGGVTKIGRESFSGCTGLTELVIPDGVTEIGQSAFLNCTHLRGLTIPSGVAEFNFLDAVGGCSSLTRLDVAAGNPSYSSEDGVLFDKARTTLLLYPAGKQGAYSVPEGVSAIGVRAFEDCAGLPAVTIPDGVTSIGAHAFQGCEALAEITSPASVASIGKQAFERTAWLEKQSGFALLNNILVCCKEQGQAVTIPDGVTIIGPDAFVGCPDLVSVTIPDSVTSIDEVTEIIYPRDAGTFGRCWKLADVFIGNGDTQIGKFAFSWLQQLSMSTFSTETIHVTVHAPAGGKVEAYCKEHQIAFVSTGAGPASLPAVEPIPAAGTAYARTQTVKLDGKDVEFQCYAVKNAEGNENNYVKVRDLAQALNGTKAQFNVGWGGKISITSSTAYEAVGGEGSTPYTGDQPYRSVSDIPVSFNGSAVNLTSFSITYQGGGYTYYKLRDLGQLLNFNVTWDNGVIVETDKPYAG